MMDWDTTSQESAAPRRRRNLIVPALFTTANLFAGFYATVAALKGY